MKNWGRSGRWTEKQRKDLEELRVDPDNGKKTGRRYGVKRTDDEEEMKRKRSEVDKGKDMCEYCGEEASKGCEG